MAYIDCAVIPVPTKNLDEYKKMARKFGKAWLGHGALSYAECLADDVAPGKRTSFPRSVKQKPDETVVIALITYKSRKHRDQVMGRMMKDPLFANFNAKAMPFDAKRMFFGGFKPIVELA